MMRNKQKLSAILLCSLPLFLGNSAAYATLEPEPSFWQKIKGGVRKGFTSIQDLIKQNPTYSLGVAGVLASSLGAFTGLLPCQHADFILRASANVLISSAQNDLINYALVPKEDKKKFVGNVTVGISEKLGENPQLLSEVTNTLNTTMDNLSSNIPERVESGSLELSRLILNLRESGFLDSKEITLADAEQALIYYGDNDWELTDIDSVKEKIGASAVELKEGEQEYFQIFWECITALSEGDNEKAQNGLNSLWSNGKLEFRLITPESYGLILVKRGNRFMIVENNGSSVLPGDFSIRINPEANPEAVQNLRTEVWMGFWYAIQCLHNQYQYIQAIEEGNAILEDLQNSGWLIGKMIEPADVGMAIVSRGEGMQSGIVSYADLLNYGGGFLLEMTEEFENYPQGIAAKDFFREALYAAVSGDPEDINKASGIFNELWQHGFLKATPIDDIIARQYANAQGAL